MKEMKDKRRFGVLMTKLRREQKVTLEQLSYGLCSQSMLNKAELGERLLDKALRDRILERLGSTSDGYEVFLGCEDYFAYEQRMDILHCLEEQEFEKAGMLIQNYRHKYGTKQPIEEQFCLTMEAEVKKLQGAGKEVQKEFWRKAVYCTMPEIETKDITKIVLSPKEWNLLLEYMACQETEKLEKWYEVFLSCLEKPVWEQKNMVKIYPKAVIYYCTYLVEEKNIYDKSERILSLCDKAIEMLRNTEKMYFLWELLNVRELALNALRDKEIIIWQGRTIAEILQETQDWKAALLFVVREGFYPEILTEQEQSEKLKTKKNCYLYWENGVYSIGDVIRIRRKMQGMTRKELCEGICAEKTLIAIEKKKRTPQEQIRIELFERLNLSAEYQRKYHYVGEDIELYELDENMSKCINKKEWEKASLWLELLEKRLDMDILLNKQFVLRTKTLLEWRQKKISQEDVVMRYQEIIGFTLKYEDVFNWSEIYLTKMELLCLYNLMVSLADAEKQEFFNFFVTYFTQYEKTKRVYSCISEYELVMTYIASAFGNMKEFLISNQLERKILKECLRYYRISMFHMNLHSIWWNQKQGDFDLVEKSHVHRNETWLEYCIFLSRLCGDTYYADKYSKELLTVTR